MNIKILLRDIKISSIMNEEIHIESLCKAFDNCIVYEYMGEIAFYNSSLTVPFFCLIDSRKKMLVDESILKPLIGHRPNIYDVEEDLNELFEIYLNSKLLGNYSRFKYLIMSHLNQTYTGVTNGEKIDNKKVFRNLEI